ncbi:MAG: hypothetical protein KA988_00175 [Longilinea sp.]|nr:hypothetical protein [Longilinea sp.]
MLVLLPILLLMFAAGAVLLVQRLRPGFGPAWLTNIGLTLLTWIIVLVMRWQTTPPFIIEAWFPISGSGNTLVLNFDAISWPYAFALISVVLAVMLTLPVRLPASASSGLWARNLAISSMGLLSVLSANPLAFVLNWTAIDLVELIVRLTVLEEEPARSQIVLAFGVRVGGTVCLMAALVSSYANGTPLSFESLDPQSGLWLLLAAGLRLGVLPLNLPFTREDPRRRGLGTILRMVAAASSLALLARLPQNSFPATWQPFLLGLCTLAALYGAAMWAASDNSLNGRPYWLISLAALAIACVVQNTPTASIAWGLALLLIGSVLFLYSAHDQRVVAIPILAVLILPGFPFTPFSSGWSGLLTLPINSSGIIFLISVGLLMVGAIRPLLHLGREMDRREGWVLAVYPLGLLIPTAAAWIFASVQPNRLTAERWWAAPIALLFTSFAIVLFYRSARRENEPRPWLQQAAQRLASSLAALLSLNWVYGLLWWVYRQLEKLVALISLLFEGDGGVLWVMVLLTLLISIIGQAKTP